MHMMDTGKGDMMAAWRATGGAIEAMGRGGDRAEGDDGLAATMPSIAFGCRADDGLQATAPTNFAPGYGCADDGLAASMHSNGHRCWGADDGLGATAFSGRPYGCADDGLAASMGTGHFPMCADDGLQATAVSGRPEMGCYADDGLTATAYSGAPYPACI